MPPAETVRRLRDSFQKGRSRSIDWRRGQLRRLRQMLVEREDAFLEALRDDLGKCRAEGWVSEVGFLRGEIDYTLKHLGRWLRPERTATPLSCLPGQSEIRREPLGVALILGAWNYPIQLVLAPLVGALAAGNCAVLKPSELAAASAEVVARYVPQYLDPECVAVVEGGAAEATALLAERFDAIFYTGGASVGRIVMEAAAKHLTPFTLELGGKSPCLVDRDVDLAVAARRIVWGRFLNAGQTCVAPDYVLVDRRRQRELLEAMIAAIGYFYGPDPRQSPDFGRIVNRRHFERLKKLLDDGEVIFGGEQDAETRYLGPTILIRVPPGAAVMEEEIFGPILPVLPVADVEEAVQFVRARPKPLALYLFSRDQAVQKHVVEATSSGSVCINDTLMQLAVPGLPFGGVGASGLGAYHGRHTFETFSHRKAILTRTTRFDLPLRYPPYSEGKLAWLRRLL